MENLLHEIAETDNDTTLKKTLNKQKIKSKSLNQKIRKKLSFLNSTKEAIKLRIKISIPPLFIDFNYSKFSTLTQSRKLQILVHISNINRLSLEKVENLINDYSLKFINHAKPNSTLPDINNTVSNYKEWNNINKWLREKPFENHHTSTFPELVRIHQQNGLCKDLLKQVKQIIKQINTKRSEPTNNTPETIFADIDKTNYLKQQAAGIFTISENPSFKLPINVIKALTFGLNFIPTKKNYPSKGIDDSFKDFEYRLRWKFFWHHKNEKNALNTNTSILPRSLRKNIKTTPPSNSILSHYVNEIKSDFKTKTTTQDDPPESTRMLSRAINNTIKFFKTRREDLVLKPADKGSSTVIIEKKFYTNSINSYLTTNKKYFLKIDFDPTLPLLNRLEQELSKMRKANIIDSRTQRILTPDKDEARCPYLYGLPKIHKLPVSFRPIVSGNGHPTEKLSILIDYLLQPYVSLNNFFLKDSTDLLKTLQTIHNLDKNTYLFSLDVVSMYTNIPLDELITSIMDTLNQNPIDMLKHKNTTYKPALLQKLLELTLYNNFFQFDGEFFQQIHGIAMGTPCACSTSDIYICNWIKQAFEKIEKKPMLYKQYRDDGFGIWKGNPEELLSFVNELNQLHPTLKFTVTFGKKIDYLDLTININDYGNITTETYYKPTDSFAYLHKESNHPKHCIENIALSQAIRHTRNCTNFSTYLYHTHFLKHNLIQKGHNYRNVSQKIRKIKFNKRQKLLNYTKSRTLTRTPLIITHNHNMPNLQKIVKQLTDKIIDQDNLNAIGGIPIIGYKVQKSIGASIIRAKL